MWQKAHPIGLRVGIIKSWPTEWFAKTKSQSAQFFVEDVKIRALVDTFYHRSWVAKVIIRKTDKEGEIIIFSSKIWVIMWKDGIKLKSFEEKLLKQFGKPFKLTVKSVKKPELSARIMAEFAAMQIEWRMPFRRVCKQTVEKVMEKGAQWVKIQVAWRLGWVDIARSEKFSEWRVPLQTLRADIDYCYTQAHTKHWVVWIKVWIAKWDVYEKKIGWDKNAQSE